MLRVLLVVGVGLVAGCGGPQQQQQQEEQPPLVFVGQPCKARDQRYSIPHYLVAWEVRNQSNWVLDVRLVADQDGAGYPEIRGQEVTVRITESATPVLQWPYDYENEQSSQTCRMVFVTYESQSGGPSGRSPFATDGCLVPEQLATCPGSEG